MKDSENFPQLENDFGDEEEESEEEQQQNQE
jgi:hypothetical protein